MTTLRRLALLLVPIGGLLELVLQVVFAHRAPRFEAWADVAPAVDAMKRPGDLVVVAPAWADPAARHALGDARMPIREEARPDVTGYAAAIEVDAMGQRAADLVAFREVERRDVGGFVVRRLENPNPAHVVYSFTDHVQPPFADVHVTAPDAACRWNDHATIVTGGFGGHPTFPRERFECPGGPFFFVGVTVIADEAFRPRRCIWSHPPNRGEVVTRFRGVPLGDVLRGHSGINWITERDTKGALVTLVVTVDGDVVGRVVHVDGQGFAPFSFPLGAHARREHADVSFAVSSPANANRHYCFEADTR